MTGTTKLDDDKLQVASDITRPQQINNNNSLALEWAELVNSEQFEQLYGNYVIRPSNSNSVCVATATPTHTWPYRAPGVVRRTNEYSDTLTSQLLCMYIDVVYKCYFVS